MSRDFHSAERNDGLSTQLLVNLNYCSADQSSCVWAEVDGDLLYSNESNMTWDNVHLHSVPIKHHIVSHVCHKCLNTPCVLQGNLVSPHCTWCKRNKLQCCASLNYIVHDLNLPWILYITLRCEHMVPQQTTPLSKT